MMISKIVLHPPRRPCSPTGCRCWSWPPCPASGMASMPTVWPPSAPSGEVPEWRVRRARDPDGFSAGGDRCDRFSVPHRL